MDNPGNAFILTRGEVAYLISQTGKQEMSVSGEKLWQQLLKHDSDDEDPQLTLAEKKLIRTLHDRLIVDPVIVMITKQMTSASEWWYLVRKNHTVPAALICGPSFWVVLQPYTRQSDAWHLTPCETWKTAAVCIKDAMPQATIVRPDPWHNANNMTLKEFVNWAREEYHE